MTAGDITIVGETYTDNWDPAIAQTQTEQFLTAANNDVQAILSENDGMAGGVVAALQAQGLAGQVPVSGQDGDQAALNRVALGTQAVSVWKDARELGTAAGEAAVQLCANPDVAAVAGTAPFTTPGGIDVTSILLTPIPSPRTTSTSSSTRAGPTRPMCARAWRPVRWPSVPDSFHKRGGARPRSGTSRGGARTLTTGRTVIDG